MMMARHGDSFRDEAQELLAELESALIDLTLMARDLLRDCVEREGNGGAVETASIHLLHCGVPTAARPARGRRAPLKPPATAILPL